MESLPDRIASRFVTDENGCWIWQGAKLRNGYGTTTYNARTEYVHRVLYRAAKGPIPEGHWIDHLCRVRLCANPEHLEAVSPRENILRGLSSAVNTARAETITHCVKGHEYTPENTRICRRKNGSTYRECRECRKVWNRVDHAKRKAARELRS